MEIKNFIDGAYKRAFEILKTQRDKLELLATTLLEKETLEEGNKEAARI